MRMGSGWRATLAGLTAVMAVASSGAATAAPSTRDSRPSTRDSVGESTRRRHQNWFVHIFFGSSAGGSGCDEIVAGRPGQTVHVERLQEAALCFPGLDERRPATVTLRAPSGVVRTYPAEHGEWNGWGLDLLAARTGGDLSELGTYRFQARGHTAGRPVTISGSLVVSPAAAPDIRWTGEPGPGRELVFQASGYRPGTVVDIAAFAQTPVVLRPTPSGDERALFRAVADLPPLRTDGRGEGLVRWRMPDRPAPNYGFWIDPSPEYDDCVRSLCQFTDGG